MDFHLGKKKHALEIKGALICCQYGANNISVVRAMVGMNGFTFLSSPPAGVSKYRLNCEWARKVDSSCNIGLRRWIFWQTSPPAQSKHKRNPVSENKSRKLWLDLVTCLGPNIRWHKQKPAGL